MYIYIHIYKISLQNQNKPTDLNALSPLKIRTNFLTVFEKMKIYFNAKSIPLLNQHRYFKNLLRASKVLGTVDEAINKRCTLCDLMAPTVKCIRNQQMVTQVRSVKCFNSKSKIPRERKTTKSNLNLILSQQGSSEVAKSKTGRIQGS